MLKYIFLFIPFVWVSSLYGQVSEYAFDHRITYKVSFMKDSTNRENVTTEYMELLIGDSLKVFRSYNRARIDSLNYATEQKRNAWVAAGSVGEIAYERPPQTNFNYVIFHEQDKSIYVETLQDQNTYLYEETETPVWQLTDETTMIEDYLCQKATTEWGNRIWEAWFCIEVPIDYGPYMFQGLPGLIISLKDMTGSWNFELAGISNIVNSAILNDNRAQSNIKKVEKSEFYKSRKYLHENFFDINISSGRIRYADEHRKNEARAAFVKRVKEDNNWIELYP